MEISLSSQKLHSPILLCSLAMFLLLASCVFLKTGMQDETNTAGEWNIFFTVESKDSIEVWEVYIDDSDRIISSQSLYKTPRYYPISVLPKTEQAFLSDDYKEYLYSSGVSDVRLEKGLGNLRVSPNRDFITWQENLSTCRFPVCYGSQEYLLWNLTKDHKDVLVTYPFHIDETVSQFVSNPSWAANNQYLAYILGLQGTSLGKVYTVDITTGQIAELATNAYSYSWAPNSYQIAYVGWKYVDGSRHAFVRLKSLENQEEIEFYNDWVDIRSLRWLPSENYIVVVALSQQDIANEKWGLYVLNVEHKTVDRVDSLTRIVGSIAVNQVPKSNTIVLTSVDKKTLEIVNLSSKEVLSSEKIHQGYLGLSPSWAPSGQVIAVNTYPTEELLNSNGIIFYNAKDGSILAWLNLERASEDWLWDNLGHKILLNLQDKSIPCSTSEILGLGLFDWHSEKLIPLSLPQHLGEKVSNCEIIIQEIEK